MSNEEFVAKLSTLALKFSPGARWEYGVSTDVLGRLVEVVDGKKLGEALGDAHLQAARHGRHRLPGAGRQAFTRGAARAAAQAASR